MLRTSYNNVPVNQLSSTSNSSFTGHAEPTVFIHVNRVRSGRFDLWVRVNLSRPELARIISLVSLLLLSLVPTCTYITTSTSKGLVMH